MLALGDAVGRDNVLQKYTLRDLNVVEQPRLASKIGTGWSKKYDLFLDDIERYVLLKASWRKELKCERQDDYKHAQIS